MIIKAYNGHDAMKIWREEIDRMGCEADEAFYRELIGRCDDLDLAAVFVKEMKSKGVALEYSEFRKLVRLFPAKYQVPGTLSQIDLV